MRFLLSLLLLARLASAAEGPVYLLLWFDTEDYIEPASDDAALRIATDLSNLGVRATFKVVGEKARVLESRGRKDVIHALEQHAIGYHENWHSIQPVPAVFLRPMGYLEGADEFERREMPGVLDIRRVFGVSPDCYGQPGSSWGPQSNLALRRMGIPIYLDEGTQVGVGEQPFWYDGLLYVFNMGSNLIRPNLDDDSKNEAIRRKFDEAVARLGSSGGGVISSYFHPNEFVNAEFWDAANFPHGATPPRADWKGPRRRTPESSEHCYRVLREYADHARQTKNVRLITADDLLRLYEGPLPTPADRAAISAHLQKSITYFRTPTTDLSPADILIQLLDLPPQVVDGPLRRGVTTLPGAPIPRHLFEQARKDAASYISTHHRLPAEVFIGARTLALADFAATLAGDGGTGDVKLSHGTLEIEKYVTDDPAKPWDWPIHPEGFSAPELVELAKLQAWTLKPARLR